MNLTVTKPGRIVCEQVERKAASKFNVTSKEYDLVVLFVGDGATVKVGDKLVAETLGEFVVDGKTYHYTDEDNVIGVLK